MRGLIGRFRRQQKAGSALARRVTLKTRIPVRCDQNKVELLLLLRWSRWPRGPTIIKNDRCSIFRRHQYCMRFAFQHQWRWFRIKIGPGSYLLIHSDKIYRHILELLHGIVTHFCSGVTASKYKIRVKSGLAASMFLSSVGRCQIINDYC